MTETEYLGSQKVCRSAEAVKTAQRTTIYFGVCERDNRPVRFEMPADMGKIVNLPCFVCTLPVTAERLVSVETHLDCDGACRSARRNFCSCGCGGINHGRVWGQGALLDSREVVESAIEAYRAEQVKIAERREAKREAAARTANKIIDTWREANQELVARLEPWYEHRTDDAWQPRHWGSHILVDFAIQTGPGWNAKPNPLSEKQVALAWRILSEITDQQRKEAERQAGRQAKTGAGDQATLVPGVYKLRGEIYVVKGNQVYVSWRKQLREHGGDLGKFPRPHDARLYAKRLVESAARVTESGAEIPFELVYAPGVIFDLAITDRMPLAEAEELTTRYSACIACGRHLKAAKSVRAAIGPVCIKLFGPVLEEDRAA